MIVAQIDISNPDKVLFPDSESSKDGRAGLTKRDLAEYYASVARVMLPHLTDRPISMQRFPDGIDSEGFYEKKVPSHFPDWIDTAEVDTANGPQSQVTVNSARALVYLANQGCITPHTWLSRTRALNRPDQLVFDLDPSVDDIASLRRATTMTGDLLNDIGLTSYLKSSGARGYHVVVPLRPQATFDETQAFALEVAEHLAKQEPDLLTVEQRKSNRGDRVYIDITGNSFGQTIVPPYAVRARPGGPVSTPMEWYELPRLAPGDYTIANLRRRLATRGDPWHGIRRRAHGLTKAREKLVRLR
ncbi:non-homologous end-joining DNA ligase [Mycolicibacterium komossense]|uniref:DNA ligase n=1 Tax=Mycolicibacterium komossense TaxID=1779 RepID=A0ABT3CBW2_9MYCO|nr:non-homologous end-joining DNA ligase [Mycolicibacterium komossense]MCV7226878.1 DNA ligase [Mycolicibacterium komossense]